MNKIRHISFDLWLTLLKSNPKFKEAKAALLHDLYNPDCFSVEVISGIMRKVDVQSTRMAEITGRNVNPLDMICRILLDMNYEYRKKITLKVLTDIHQSIQELYLQNLPSPYSEDTIPCLDKLFNKVEVLTVGSNTGFVVSSTVREGLKRLDMFHYFDDEVFSDECGYAKPNPLFFLEIITKDDILLPEMLHVGDNLIADGEGAKLAGLNGMIINSNNLTIKDVVTLIENQ